MAAARKERGLGLHRRVDGRLQSGGSVRSVQRFRVQPGGNGCLRRKECRIVPAKRLSGKRTVEPKRINSVIRDSGCANLIVALFWLGPAVWAGETPRYLPTRVFLFDCLGAFREDSEGHAYCSRGVLRERWSGASMMPALGIQYIAAVLETDGIDVEIVPSHVLDLSWQELAPEDRNGPPRRGRNHQRRRRIGS